MNKKGSTNQRFVGLFRPMGKKGSTNQRFVGLFRPMGKKGVEAWISYVLLVMLMVVIGTMVFLWSRTYTQEVSEGFEQRFDTEKCSKIGISVDAILNDESITVRVKNKDYLRVNKIIFKIYNNTDIYTEEAEARVKPDRFIELTVSTGSLANIEYFEAVPVYIDTVSKEEIICLEKKEVFRFE